MNWQWLGIKKGVNIMKRIFTSFLALIILVLSVASSLTVTATDEQISYKSTISYDLRQSSLPSKLNEYVREFRRINDNRDIYFVIDNYDLYKELGFSEKGRSFYEDNLLILNCVYGGIGPKESRKNTGVIVKDGVINVSYTRTLNYPIPCWDINTVDIIELSKSDVKDVDLTKLVVKFNTIHNNCDNTQHETDSLIPMKYIDAYGIIDKPEKVKKVKLKSTKTKQLKITWKKIKNVKYQVKYSLKKNMRKAKTKKNITKNTVTLKKLKSGKKYYVRVRAYQKIGSKTYIGKWSKVVGKKVK